MLDCTLELILTLAISECETKNNNNIGNPPGLKVVLLGFCRVFSDVFRFTDISATYSACTYDGVRRRTTNKCVNIAKGQNGWTDANRIRPMIVPPAILYTSEGYRGPPATLSARGTGRVVSYTTYVICRQVVQKSATMTCTRCFSLDNNACR